MIELSLQQQLDSLIGLQLTIARRAASMRVFHFGTLQTNDRGTVGHYALHIQCPWRFDGPDGIITGHADLWEVASGDTPPDWEYEDGENLQDARIAAIFGGYEASSSSHLNATSDLVVEQIETTRYGDAVIRLSGNYRLVLFPDGITGEAWRLFRPDSKEPHFVVEQEALRGTIPTGVA